MPLRTKSAKKKHRQSLKKRDRNRFYKSTLKSKIKEFNASIEQNDINRAEEYLKILMSGFDTAASKGVYKKETASRYISRLSSKLDRIKSSGKESQAG